MVRPSRLETASPSGLRIPSSLLAQRRGRMPHLPVAVPIPPAPRPLPWGVRLPAAPVPFHVRARRAHRNLSLVTFHLSLAPQARSLCVLCVFLLRFPCPENFFQSLENARKIFPIIGKIRPFFSNHWKKVFQSLENFPRARRARTASFHFSLFTFHS